MPPLTPEQQRALRRRRQHERQAVIFGSLIATLALAGLGATAVYTGAMDVPFLAREFSTKTPSPTTALPSPPCPTEEMVPAGYETIEVRVYNASQRAGLAGSTADALASRGFIIVETANYPLASGIDSGARIAFGEAGIEAAYTLRAQLEDPPVMLLDTRPDASIDLILGSTFGGVLDESLVVLDPTSPLIGVSGCIPLEEARQAAVPGPTRSPTPATEAPDESVEADAG